MGGYWSWPAPSGPPRPVRPSTATVWDLDLDREAGRLVGRPGAPLPDRAAISARGRCVALGYADGSIEIWDLAARQLRATSRAHQRGFSSSSLTRSPDGSILASDGKFRSLTFSFGLARAAYKHVFRNWDDPTVSELLLLDSRDGHTLLRAQECMDDVFLAVGRSIATSHVDGNIRVHDVPKPR